jgi:hypothetical protein
VDIGHACRSRATSSSSLRHRLPPTGRSGLQPSPNDPIARAPISCAMSVALKMQWKRISFANGGVATLTPDGAIPESAHEMRDRSADDRVPRG